MAHDHDFTAVQMYWKPPLVRLSQIPDVYLGDGTTTCFVDAQQIVMINRQVRYQSEPPLDGKPHSGEGLKWRPGVPCTVVSLSVGVVLNVEETPEEVAMLRDKSLGHEPPKPKAVP